MDERDILISDVRVTALAKHGQYVFEWEDEEQQIVSFLPEESDFEELNDDVRHALKANDLRINDSLSGKKPTSGDDSANTTSDIEPIGDTDIPEGMDDNLNTDTSHNPEENSEAKTKITGGITGESSDVDTSDSDIDKEESTGEHSSSDIDEKKDTTEYPRQISFRVRIGNPKERQQIIDQLREQNENAGIELQLTGPYEVKYKVSEDGSIELVGVEDIGIDSNVNGN